MGQCKSTDPVSLGPFAAARHLDSCHLRDVINKRDFVVFLSELKKTLNRREYVAFVAEGMTFSHDGDEPDVLAYKVNISDQLHHHVYLKCECPTKYAGMNINQLDSRGQAALHVALRKRDCQMVRLLLSLGSDPGQYSRLGLAPIHIACETGDIGALTLLLQAGVSPDTQEKQVPKIYQHFRTALTISASNGDIQSLSKLLDSGAEVNVPDSKGNTALHKAALFGHTACLKALLLQSADPNVQNSIGATPLQLALLQMHTDVVQMLMKAGSDAIMASDELPSNLVLAALTGETEVVHQCAQSIANLDLRDRTGVNALYYTFTGDIVRLQSHYQAIASHGINMDFQYCQLNGRAETFSFLVQEGCDVESMLEDAFSFNILTVKHFTLPHNVDMFILCLRACGFIKISVKDVDALFWKLLGRNSHILVKLLVCALPCLDSHIKPKLLDVADWTGVHTVEAVLRYLENAGAEGPLAKWIQIQMDQPRSLQEWCRQRIRQSISRNVIFCVRSLPLPQKLKEYVTLDDVTS